MKITVLELFTIKKLLQEEIKRIGKYNQLIHNSYTKNIKNIYDKVDLEISKVKGSSKTTHKSVKKYMFVM